jgi:glyoxylase-like metal-dependent hydrolase (beta-lactamase superfamily II)
MFRTILLAFTCFVACVAAQADAIELPRPKGTSYGYFEEAVAPGVTVLHQNGEFHVQPRGNVVVIEQANGIVLVDSGGSPAAADQIVALLARNGGKPVKAIILTHWHGDHVLGVSRLLAKWPSALVIGTPSTREMLAASKTDRFMPGNNAAANTAFMKNVEGAIAYLENAGRDTKLTPDERTGFARAAIEYRQYGNEMQSARRVPPNVVLEDEIILKDDARPVHVRFLGRANTAGDAIVWLPGQRIVATGDTVVAPIPFGSNTFPSEWIRVLERIRALDFTIMIPGHGRPSRDKAQLENLMDMLKHIRTQVAPFANNTTPLANVISTVDLTDQETAIAGKDPWLRRWFRDYWRDPIISSALREARGQPVIQGEY